MSEQQWRPDFLQASLIFEPLSGAGRYLEKLRKWPSLGDLNNQLANLLQPIKTTSGHSIRYVSQDISVDAFAKRYEPRIYLTGAIQTRAQNWHDLFNALVWLTFPRAKAMLNQLHYQALLQEQQANETCRGSLRDAATLFDESGVVVVSSHDQLSQMLRGFEWKALFWERRAMLGAHMKFFIFGHGLYEKGLNPYIGMTGKGIVLSVGADFFSQPLQKQLLDIDEKLAGFIGQNLSVSTDLTPVPVLGYPGWSLDNSDSRYYDNKRYFRARPKPVN
ncbi:MAG: DUF3025 domain-containing protein [Nitrosomonas sp.]|nr:DUF3025 domain-containing protein [Nitrosomonas sp.]